MASRNKETKSSEVTAARPFLAAHGINQTDWTRLSRSSGARLEDFEVLSWPFVNLNAFLNVTGIQRRRRDTLFIMTFARSKLDRRGSGADSGSVAIVHNPITTIRASGSYDLIRILQDRLLQLYALSM
jgi:hypothetical protein